jgi:hypothetical protein
MRLCLRQSVGIIKLANKFASNPRTPLLLPILKEQHNSLSSNNNGVARQGLLPPGCLATAIIVVACKNKSNILLSIEKFFLQNTYILVNQHKAKHCLEGDFNQVRL